MKRVRDHYFLSNVVNKQNFIHLLADHLSHSNYYVEYTKADADFLIAQNAIAAAHQSPYMPTILVADDTDIPILLSWHVKPSTPDTVYLSDQNFVKVQK